ncbi:DUF6197 family protein [Nonomuraea wenchangensis]|uniref:Uncharacterized protein n=1 Tax=Nonomuraea wenchangensis TaxID=568860 RepID=A0A1I0F351_9ACTN|nr:hypothetical protein [Nonomuraea wenchangensis]SET52460.1 hypothetical protein SAMN05421811_103308 [Nonomuraea wenchangensis]
MNAASILADAITVLEQRGMCSSNFVIASGAVDAFGALAVAAGSEPDVWMGLSDWNAPWEPSDRQLVDAAFYLAELVLPGRDVVGMPLDDLITDVGDRLDAMSLHEVLDALAKAAHEAGLAEKAEARA